MSRFISTTTLNSVPRSTSSSRTIRLPSHINYSKSFTKKPNQNVFSVHDSQPYSICQNYSRTFSSKPEKHENTQFTFNNEEILFDDLTNILTAESPEKFTEFLKTYLRNFNSLSPDIVLINVMIAAQPIRGDVFIERIMPLYSPLLKTTDTKEYCMLLNHIFAVLRVYVGVDTENTSLIIQKTLEQLILNSSTEKLKLLILNVSQSLNITYQNSSQNYSDSSSFLSSSSSTGSLEYTSPQMNGHTVKKAYIKPENVNEVFSQYSDVPTLTPAHPPSPTQSPPTSSSFSPTDGEITISLGRGRGYSVSVEQPEPELVNHHDRTPPNVENTSSNSNPLSLIPSLPTMLWRNMDSFAAKAYNLQYQLNTAFLDVEDFIHGSSETETVLGVNGKDGGCFSEADFHLYHAISNLSHVFGLVPQSSSSSFMTASPLEPFSALLFEKLSPSLSQFSNNLTYLGKKLQPSQSYSTSESLDTSHHSDGTPLDSTSTHKTDDIHVNIDDLNFDSKFTMIKTNIRDFTTPSHNALDPHTLTHFSDVTTLSALMLLQHNLLLTSLSSDNWAIMQTVVLALNNDIPLHHLSQAVSQLKQKNTLLPRVSSWSQIKHLHNQSALDNFNDRLGVLSIDEECTAQFACFERALPSVIVSLGIVSSISSVSVQNIEFNVLLHKQQVQSPTPSSSTTSSLANFKQISDTITLLPTFSQANQFKGVKDLMYSFNDYHYVSSEDLEINFDQLWLSLEQGGKVETPPLTQNMASVLQYIAKIQYDSNVPLHSFNVLSTDSTLNSNLTSQFPQITELLNQYKLSVFITTYALSTQCQLLSVLGSLVKHEAERLSILHYNQILCNDYIRNRSIIKEETPVQTSPTDSSDDVKLLTDSSSPPSKSSSYTKDDDFHYNTVIPPPSSSDSYEYSLTMGIVCPSLHQLHYTYNIAPKHNNSYDEYHNFDSHLMSAGHSLDEDGGEMEVTGDRYMDQYIGYNYVLDDSSQYTPRFASRTSTSDKTDGNTTHSSSVSKLNSVYSSLVVNRDDVIDEENPFFKFINKFYSRLFIKKNAQDGEYRTNPSDSAYSNQGVSLLLNKAPPPPYSPSGLVSATRYPIYEMYSDDVSGNDNVMKPLQPSSFSLALSSLLMTPILSNLYTCAGVIGYSNTVFKHVSIWDRDLKININIQKTLHLARRVNIEEENVQSTVIVLDRPSSWSTEVDLSMNVLVCLPKYGLSDHLVWCHNHYYTRHTPDIYDYSSGVGVSSPAVEEDAVSVMYANNHIMVQTGMFSDDPVSFKSEEPNKISSDKNIVSSSLNTSSSRPLLPSLYVPDERVTLTFVRGSFILNEDPDEDLTLYTLDEVDARTSVRHAKQYKHTPHSSTSDSVSDPVSDPVSESISSGEDGVEYAEVEHIKHDPSTSSSTPSSTKPKTSRSSPTPTRTSSTPTPASRSLNSLKTNTTDNYNSIVWKVKPNIRDLTSVTSQLPLYIAHINNITKTDSLLQFDSSLFDLFPTLSPPYSPYFVSLPSMKMYTERMNNNVTRLNRLSSKYVELINLDWDYDGMNAHPVSTDKYLYSMLDVDILDSDSSSVLENTDDLQHQLSQLLNSTPNDQANVNKLQYILKKRETDCDNDLSSHSDVNLIVPLMVIRDIVRAHTEIHFSRDRLCMFNPSISASTYFLPLFLLPDILPQVFVNIEPHKSLHNVIYPSNSNTNSHLPPLTTPQSYTSLKDKNQSDTYHITHTNLAALTYINLMHEIKQYQGESLTHATELLCCYLKYPVMNVPILVDSIMKVALHSGLHIILLDALVKLAKHGYIPGTGHSHSLSVVSDQASQDTSPNNIWIKQIVDYIKSKQTQYDSHRSFVKQVWVKFKESHSMVDDSHAPIFFNRLFRNDSDSLHLGHTGYSTTGAIGLQHSYTPHSHSPSLYLSQKPHSNVYDAEYQTIDSKSHEYPDESEENLTETVEDFVISTFCKWLQLSLLATNSEYYPYYNNFKHGQLVDLKTPNPYSNSNSSNDGSCVLVNLSDNLPDLSEDTDDGVALYIDHALNSIAAYSAVYNTNTTMDNNTVKNAQILFKTESTPDPDVDALSDTDSYSQPEDSYTEPDSYSSQSNSTYTSNYPNQTYSNQTYSNSSDLHDSPIDSPTNTHSSSDIDMVQYTQPYPTTPVQTYNFFGNSSPRSIPGLGNNPNTVSPLSRQAPPSFNRSESVDSSSVQLPTSFPSRPPPPFTKVSTQDDSPTIIDLVLKTSQFDKDHDSTLGKDVSRKNLETVQSTIHLDKSMLATFLQTIFSIGADSLHVGSDNSPLQYYKHFVSQLSSAGILASYTPDIYRPLVYWVVRNYTKKMGLTHKPNKSFFDGSICIDNAFTFDEYIDEIPLNFNSFELFNENCCLFLQDGLVASLMLSGVCPENDKNSFTSHYNIDLFNYLRSQHTLSPDTLTNDLDILIHSPHFINLNALSLIKSSYQPLPSTLQPADIPPSKPVTINQDRLLSESNEGWGSKLSPFAPKITLLSQIHDKQYVLDVNDADYDLYDSDCSDEEEVETQFSVSKTIKKFYDVYGLMDTYDVTNTDKIFKLNDSTSHQSKKNELWTQLRQINRSSKSYQMELRRSKLVTMQGTFKLDDLILDEDSITSALDVQCANIIYKKIAERKIEQLVIAPNSTLPEEIDVSSNDSPHTHTSVKNYVENSNKYINWWFYTFILPNPSVATYVTSYSKTNCQQQDQS